MPHEAPRLQPGLLGGGGFQSTNNHHFNCRVASESEFVEVPDAVTLIMQRLDRDGYIDPED